MPEFVLSMSINSGHFSVEPSTILTALITGATVALSDTAGQAVKDAYGALKSVLVGKFGFGSISTLEKDPSDTSFRQSTEKELRLIPEILKDEQVHALVITLYSAIENNVSPNALGEIGVDVQTIRSERDTIIKSISDFASGVKVGVIESGNDTVIQDVRGKSKA